MFGSVKNLFAKKSESHSSGTLLAVVDEAVFEKKLYLHHRLTVDELARAAGTNRTYLWSALRSCGLSFKDYINRYRLAHFMHNLRYYRSEGLTVELMADESGFCSAKRLNSAMRRSFGMTVGEFIRRFPD